MRRAGPISSSKKSLGSRPAAAASSRTSRSEEHTSELQSQSNLVCRLLLEKKKHHRYKPASGRLMQMVCLSAVLSGRAWTWSHGFIAESVTVRPSVPPPRCPPSIHEQLPHA